MEKWIFLTLSPQSLLSQGKSLPCAPAAMAESFRKLPPGCLFRQSTILRC